MEIVLALIAYSAIIAVIVIFCQGVRSNCNQDCRQGRDCDCTNEDDMWKF